MKSKVAVLCLVTLSCPTLCNLMDCSPPGLSVHGDSPGKSTEVGSIPPPGHLPNPGVESKSPALKVNSLSSEPPGKPKNTAVGSWSLLQGIFSTQELNQGLLLYMRILYQLNYQGSPKLKVVSYQKYNKENASLEFPPAESSFSIDHDLAPFVNLFDPEELLLEVLMNEMQHSDTDCIPIITSSQQLDASFWHSDSFVLITALIACQQNSFQVTIWCPKYFLKDLKFMKCYSLESEVFPHPSSFSIVSWLSHLGCFLLSYRYP